jgi:ELWxxDGT repeat protein
VFFVSGGTSANLNNPGLSAAGIVTRQRVLDEAGNTTAAALDLGSLSGNGSYNGRVSGLDNDDMFKFVLGASTSVNLALIGLMGNADLQLLNSTGGVVATAATAGTTSEYITQTLAAGTYFARVYSTGNIGTNYRLSLSNSSIPRMLRDINPGVASSNPTSFVTIGNTAYFAAENAAAGAELWKTDGTTNGTVLVKDILAGVDGSDPYNLTVVGTQIFFNAYTAANGVELWKTDGTANGTVLVKDINPGVGSSKAYEMLAMGNLLYFAANNGTNGYELWRSDGTASGTFMVKDIEVGNGDGAPYYLNTIGSTIYFAAKNSTSGYELWKSDGTTAGTTLVKDMALHNRGMR